MATIRTPPPNKRRGGPKPHQPYNDGLEYGKRTGKPIPTTQLPQDEDGMEDFERYFDMGHDEESTPVHRTEPPDYHSARGSLHPDDFGEMSMDTDTGDVLSPSAYFGPSAPRPPSIALPGSFSRPVGYHPDVDYDSLPGGSAEISLPRRKSLGPASHRRTPGPSKTPQPASKPPSQGINGSQHSIRNPNKTIHNSKSVPPSSALDRPDRSTKPAFDLEDLEHFNGGHDDNGGSYGNEMDWEGPSVPNEAHGDVGPGADDDIVEVRSKPPPPRVEDEEQEDDDPPEIQRARSKAKGKGRAPIQEESIEDPDQAGGSDLEDEIQQGLQALEEQNDLSDEEESVHPGPSKRRKKEAEVELKPVKARVLRKAKEVVARTPSPPGVRRSKRERYSPLQWWRNEKYVYRRGRRESGPNYVPDIVDVIKFPRETPPPLGAAGKYKRKRSQSVKKEIIEVEVEAEPPEKGWDADTNPHGIVMDYVTKQETTKLLAVTAAMVEFKEIPNAPFRFQKIFGDSDFIASGMVSIPKGGQKPSKPTKDNTYMFYCIEGAVQVKIHRASFIIAPGGMFTVPRGNQYLIKNISEREARLFFAQARKMVEERGTSQVPPSSGSRHSLPAPPRAPISSFPTGRAPGQIQSSRATTASPQVPKAKQGTSKSAVPVKPVTTTAAKKVPVPTSNKKVPPRK